MTDFENRLAPDTDIVGPGQRSAVEPLEVFLSREPRFAVAFSGGCDSSLLLAAAKLAGNEVRAYLVKTAFQPAFELEDARRVVDALGVPLTVIEADVLTEEAICANPPDRCCLCKAFIFRTIRKAATADGFTVLVDGTNATDDPERRPGFAALDEAGVVSPLRRAGLTKANVRAVLTQLEGSFGLEPGALMSAKPSFPCLAVYVPEGERIDGASLETAARVRGLC
ncbi:7-cyano-7-deazaguanine synthase [uncultured Adlercreutzia sp.]|uniref:7-cyano-7-deazaguanine synthase n=1 Tax=uncultured Adlercreutzia sp. TaxID=875803 RepID=UPI0025E04952|nr:7-cyano-7-deazaguanine synthase [uncultured Adlercreutzia sp.]MCI9261895.1 ExsB family transcriptional regulator [Eggerthellaceae bacterium]